jgi:hypothetical protein
VGAGTSAERATAVAAVREAIAAALPEGLQVRGPVALRLGPDCVLVPDLIVTAAGDEEEAAQEEAAQEQAAAESDGDAAGDKAVSTVGGDEVLDASAALMVIEVVGREHGAVDRTFKAAALRRRPHPLPAAGRPPRPVRHRRHDHQRPLPRVRPSPGRGAAAHGGSPSTSSSTSARSPAPPRRPTP